MPATHYSPSNVTSPPHSHFHSARPPPLLLYNHSAQLPVPSSVKHSAKPATPRSPKQSANHPHGNLPARLLRRAPTLRTASSDNAYDIPTRNTNRLVEEYPPLLPGGITYTAAPLPHRPPTSRSSNHCARPPTPQPTSHTATTRSNAPHRLIRQRRQEVTKRTNRLVEEYPPFSLRLHLAQRQPTAHQLPTYRSSNISFQQRLCKTTYTSTPEPYCHDTLQRSASPDRTTSTIEHKQNQQVSARVSPLLSPGTAATPPLSNTFHPQQWSLSTATMGSCTYTASIPT